MLFRADSETEGILWWNNRERQWIVHVHLHQPGTTTAREEHASQFSTQDPGEIIPFRARPISGLTPVSSRGPTLEDARRFLEGKETRCILLAPEGWYMLRKTRTIRDLQALLSEWRACSRENTTLLDEHRWEPLRRVGIRVTRHRWNPSDLVGR
jgi:hypothetical protein